MTACSQIDIATDSPALFRASGDRVLSIYGIAVKCRGHLHRSELEIQIVPEVCPTSVRSTRPELMAVEHTSAP